MPRTMREGFTAFASKVVCCVLLCTEQQVLLHEYCNPHATLAALFSFCGRKEEFLD